MGNDVQQGTTSDSRTKKNIEPSMRWFYCTESDSSEIPVHQREYKQFNFDMSYIIEDHFVSQKVFESEKDGIRIFHNFQTGERHYMTKINDPWVKKEIVRQDIHCKPVKCGNFINERYSKTFPVELISNYNAFPNAYSIQMCLASYNKIFENVHYSKDDPFIKNFMKFSMLIERNLARFLQNDYNKIINDQLKKNTYSQNGDSYDLAQTRLLTKVTFFQILQNNFIKYTKCDLKTYVKYYFEKLKVNEINNMIIQMFKEDGKLYKAVLTMVKNKAYKQNSELVLYYLCLLYALNNHVIKTNEMKMYIYVENNNKEHKYVKGNKYFLNEMLICRTKPMNVDNVSNSNVNKKKQLLQIEIIYKNNQLKPMKYPFLCKRPYDLGMSELYGDSEILLPNNIVLQCNGYSSEHAVQFEMITDILEEQIQYMNDREKNFFLIWDDMSYVSSNYLYNEKEVYSKTRFTRFKQKNLKFAKKFEIFSNSLESIECFGAEMNLDSLKTIINLFNKKQHCKLQYLDLSGNDIDTKGLIEINKVLPFMSETLTSINLSYNIITDESIKEINFAELGNLRYLILKENYLNQEGVSYIAENFKYLKNLIVLDLYGNKIEDEGAENIAKNIDYLENLGKLDFFNSFIGDKGIQELLPKLPVVFSTLRWVNLKQNAFGKESNIKNLCINVIEALDNIEYFNIDQNKFTECEVNEIHEAFEAKRQEILNRDMLTNNNENINDNNKQIKIDKRKGKKYCQRNISELKITSERMFNYFVKHINEYIDNLKSLNFSEYERTQEISVHHIKKFISYDTDFKNLKILNFSYCKNLSNNTFDILLSSLSHFDNLTELYLDSIQLNKKVKEFNKNMNQLCRIEKLSLCYNELDENFILDTIENYSFLISIKYIDLYGNCLNCTAMKLFCMGLKTQNNINYLNLGNNYIGNEGVIYIGECFKFLNKLMWLDLSSNCIGDGAMRIFMGSFSYLLTLKHFDLRNNLISQKTMDIILAQGIPDSFVLK